MTDRPNTPENYLDGADLEPIVDSAPAEFTPAETLTPAEMMAATPPSAGAAMGPPRMGGGGDNFFIRAVQADKAYTKFFFGFLLITIGCLMPWTEGTHLLGYYTVIGALILVVGLYGMWRLWLAMVTNKFTLGPVGLNFLVFFWGMLQILTLNAKWEHELDPEIAQKEIDAGRPALVKQDKGMFPTLIGAFGDDHDYYTLRRNVGHFGSGRIITTIGSSYVMWVFVASMFGVMKKKKPTNAPSGPARGGAGGTRRPGGATGSTTGRPPRPPRDANAPADPGVAVPPNDAPVTPDSAPKL